MVHVDEGEFTHAAARQRLGGPGAHAADAHHDDVRGADARGARHAIQALQAAEAALQVGIRKNSACFRRCLVFFRKG